MKKWIFGLSFIGLLALGITYVSLGVFAEPANYDGVALSLETDEFGEYSLEDMLTAALLDEYLAQATYEQIINTYGDVKPFTKIVLAEQQHINLLLPLFETYGITVPENQAASQVVLPDSIASALATGVEAEKANIAMYEAFLAQDNLNDDVRSVFELLKTASEHHLAAFSKDRLNGAGYNFMYQMRNMFRQGGNQNQSSRQQQRGC
ncbi:MAG TPA: hypothetical protein PLJ98_03675 [Acholeplasmataceae bacterium]|nr:hypothetical protein [Acholeplasmataceae bacterium]